MYVRVYNARHVDRDARFLFLGNDWGVYTVQDGGNSQAISLFGKDTVLIIYICGVTIIIVVVNFLLKTAVHVGPTLTIIASYYLLLQLQNIAQYWLQVCNRWTKYFISF